MKSKTKELKTKGYANLQRQLEEVRNESFKQGIWKGRNEREKELIEEFEKMIDKQVILCKGSNLLVNNLNRQLQELKNKEKK